MGVFVNVRQLECFLAVAEECHFRRAAEHLRLSPASVSEAVAALERRLGGRLFERSTRHVKLTDRGSQFLEGVREPYEQLRRAHDSAKVLGQRGVDLVIGHTPELGHLLLPTLVAAVPRRRDSGSPSWRPVLMHTRDQMRSVAEGVVDIGLCWSARDVSRPLHSVPLGDFPVVAVLRADDPLAARSEIPLPELRARRVLITPRNDNPFIDSQLQADFAEAGVPKANVEEVLRYDELVVHVVATNGSVGLHPGTIALMNRIPGVVFRPVTDPASSVTICALTRGGTAYPNTDALISVLTGIVGSIDLDTALVDGSDGTVNVS